MPGAPAPASGGHRKDRDSGDWPRPWAGHGFPPVAADVLGGGLPDAAHIRKTISKEYPIEGMSRWQAEHGENCGYPAGRPVRAPNRLESA